MPTVIRDSRACFHTVLTQSKRMNQVPDLNLETLNKIVAWQRAAGSLEVCGMLAVDNSGQQQLIQLTNHAGSPDAFEISRSDEALAWKAATHCGWEILAFIHTHPHHSPDMSPRDKRSFDRDKLPWIIIGTPTSDPTQRTYFRTDS
jgi:proteasome lid subunit RPN8/RPN11